MRDRLIELIKKGIDKHESTIENYVHTEWEYIADYLLENGVIVPPCKVGDKIYKLETQYAKYAKEETVEPYGVAYKNIFGGYALVPFDDIGKTVFLTKEEAEQALKGGEG